MRLTHYLNLWHALAENPPDAQQLEPHDQHQQHQSELDQQLPHQPPTAQQLQPQQRKRKILRKTRNTSPHSARLTAAAAAAGYGCHPHASHAHDAATSSDGLMSTACSSNFGLWIAVVMTCGWLFILSYMTAVVYSENRRLEAQLFKLSASSLAVPDELQRWHVSAKWLEQNQTAMLQRMKEADQRATALTTEVQTLRTEFARTYDDSSDHEKLTRLQNNVANFGAQLKDLNIDVGVLKERTVALRTDANTARDSLHALDTLVRTAAVGNTTAQQLLLVGGGSGGGDGGSFATPFSNASVLWLVHNVTDETRTQVHRVVADLDSAKYAFGQRAAGLEDDVRQHKARLDALTENYANVTAHVVSIENSLRERVKTRPVANSKTDVTVTAAASVDGNGGGMASALMAPQQQQQQQQSGSTSAPMVGGAGGERTTISKMRSTTTVDPALLHVLSQVSAADANARRR